jgi:hypothetical protein
VLGDRVCTGARHLRWTVRSRLAEHPGYLRVARRRHGLAVVSEDTELVIDGFTRSASTFAVVAFQLAQTRPVRVGHHLHAPAQILEAVHRGVPTLLCVRPPEDTVLSLVVREPYVTIRQGLVAYARFHERLLPVRERVVVADFAEVTEHLDRAVERVNARFGTAFTPFRTSEQAVRECFDLIEMRARRPAWSGTIQRFLSGLATIEDVRAAAAAHHGELPVVPENRAQRPSAFKEGRKAELRARYHAAALERIRARAEAAHAALAEHRPAGGSAAATSPIKP